MKKNYSIFFTYLAIRRLFSLLIYGLLDTLYALQRSSRQFTYNPSDKRVKAGLSKAYINHSF